MMKDTSPERAIEFIAFAEEEGSNFGSTCLGSKGIAGQIGVEGLKRLSNAEGSAYDALRAFGLDPDALPGEQIDPANVKAFLEVHIEQNAMLEDAGRELGIVTAISGMRLHRIVYKGHSDHAASPMQGRRDPAAGFAELAFRMEQLWEGRRSARGFFLHHRRIGLFPQCGDRRSRVGDVYH